MGRREKKLRLYRKEKKRVKKMSKVKQRKETMRKIGNLGATMVIVIGVVGVIGFALFAQFILAPGMNTREYTTFKLRVDINEDTFDVNTTLLSSHFEIYPNGVDGERENHLAIKSYQTATIEVSRVMTGGGREYWDSTHGTWGQTVGDPDPVVGDKTYNVWSIVRGFFEQDVSCYVNDHIGIVVKQFINISAYEWSGGEYEQYTEDYPRPLKYHYSISGNVGKDVDFEDDGEGLRARAQTIYGRLGTTDESIQLLPRTNDRFEEEWSYAYYRVGSETYCLCSRNDR